MLKQVELIVTAMIQKVKHWYECSELLDFRTSLIVPYSKN
jgi:hypothetical protein